MRDHILDRGHPIADKAGRVTKARYALYDQTHGQAQHCWKCTKVIHWRAGRLNATSIIVDYRDGDSTNLHPDNLVPICVRCIRKRTAKNAIGPDEVVFRNRDGRPERGLERHCQHCGNRFVVSASNVRTNKSPHAIGKYCSGSCRSTAVNLLRSAKRRAAAA